VVPSCEALPNPANPKVGGAARPWKRNRHHPLFAHLRFAPPLLEVRRRPRQRLEALHRVRDTRPETRLPTKRQKPKTQMHRQTQPRLLGAPEVL